MTWGSRALPPSDFGALGAPLVRQPPGPTCSTRGFRLVKVSMSMETFAWARCRSSSTGAPPAGWAVVRGEGQGASGDQRWHAGQGLTEVRTHEAVIGSRGPGATKGLAGLGVEHVFPALRAGGDVQGPGQPGGVAGRRLLGRLGAPLAPGRSCPHPSSCPLCHAQHRPSPASQLPHHRTWPCSGTGDLPCVVCAT